MAKAEAGTPKWLANKMKSKGLQRLRWYCQMCERQCRDENGFKCHIASEAHLRQMEVFNQRAGGFLSDFSRQFEQDFMRLMKTRYCRAPKVFANTVYCEMISNKEHTHMNSTRWVTLNGFVRHLEATNQVSVDWSNPRGPFITYIDNERIAREKAERERQRRYLSADEHEARRIAELSKLALETQQQLAAAAAETETEPPASSSPPKAVKLSLGSNVKAAAVPKREAPPDVKSLFKTKRKLV